MQRYLQLERSVELVMHFDMQQDVLVVLKWKGYGLTPSLHQNSIRC